MYEFYEGKIACSACDRKADYYKKPQADGTEMAIIECSHCGHYSQEERGGSFG